MPVRFASPNSLPQAIKKSLNQGGGRLEGLEWKRELIDSASAIPPGVSGNKNYLDVSANQREIE